ncbi:MAG: hypothetical protein A4S09_15915 [Proteobacteria bacterium SG_bin7]|nr:MAG: hypothetical protein A4S09_15915 [Proteobacteria bacterium SG_bin7]
MLMSIILFLSALFYQPAWSQRLQEDYTSARAAGMGNAFSAVVDNVDAVFYNPATLVKSAGFHWTIADINLGAGNVDALQKLSGLGSDFSGTISNLSGKTFSANGYAKTALQLGTFAFYLYENLNLGFATSNPVSPRFDIDYINDIGYGMSFAFPIIPSVMAMGISTKFIRRNGNRFSVLASDLATRDADYLKSLYDYNGTGYGFDTGFLFKIPGPVSPTLSVAWKNIGGSTFKPTTGSLGTPPADADEVTAGLALNIGLPLLSISPAIEIKHAGDPAIPFGKKLHLGVEISLLNIDIRAGLNQGYWTAGLGLGLGFADLDLATYGVETGATVGQNEDRRYMLQFSMGLGMDLGGGGGGDGGFGGEKAGENKQRAQRRLKKRR